MALDYAWGPGGTRAPGWLDVFPARRTVPFFRQWPGKYVAGVEEEVTGDDGWELSNALFRAMDDLPDEDLRDACGGPSILPTDSSGIHLPHWFSGPGKGWVGDLSERVTWVYCDRCGGSGVAVIRHQFKVRIPGRIRDRGGVVKLRGSGDIGLSGGPRGDIRLTVRHVDQAAWLNVRPDPAQDQTDSRRTSTEEALDEVAALMADLDPPPSSSKLASKAWHEGDLRSRLRRIMSSLSSWVVRFSAS